MTTDEREQLHQFLATLEAIMRTAQAVIGNQLETRYGHAQERVLKDGLPLVRRLMEEAR